MYPAELIFVSTSRYQNLFHTMHVPLNQHPTYLSQGEVEHMGHGVVGSDVGAPFVVHLAYYLTPHRQSASLHL